MLAYMDYYLHNLIITGVLLGFTLSVAVPNCDYFSNVLLTWSTGKETEQQKHPFMIA